MESSSPSKPVESTDVLEEFDAEKEEESLRFLLLSILGLVALAVILKLFIDWETADELTVQFTAVDSLFPARSLLFHYSISGSQVRFYGIH